MAVGVAISWLQVGQVSEAVDHREFRMALVDLGVPEKANLAGTVAQADQEDLVVLAGIAVLEDPAVSVQDV